ncbi:MAG TPA: cytochrome P450 [Acidimicrobiales bacterium]|nr:cytochrome P450 [Acidimicrobiales bacterium]
MNLEDVDLTNPDNYVTEVPHEMLAYLRHEHPVYWQEEANGPGFFAFTRHADVVKINQDNLTFSSHRGTALLTEMPEAEIGQQRLMMLNMDPPMHTRYRLLVNKGFTPRMVGRLEEKAHQMANNIINAVCERGECDFVTDIAAELPLQIIAELMGVPQADRHLVFNWSNQMIGQEDPEYQLNPEAPTEAALELYAYAHQLAADKRANPHDDLMSVLTSVEVDGESLSELELDMFFLLLTVAGNETTRNLISHGQLALMEHPDQRAKLLANPDLLPSAIEEMLRWGSPVMQFRRTVTKETEVGGQELHDGDKVVIWYISANRDEAVFDDPYTFDIGRQPNPHVAFGGGGPHFCLGANLARLEIRVMFDELLKRLPDMELAGEVSRLRSNFINGIKHLPVTFSKTPALASAG